MRSVRVLAALAVLAATATSGPALAAAPSGVVVTSVSATTGPTTGGEQLSVRGHGFVAVQHVLFGGALARSVHVTSSRSITVVVPRHKAGLLDIRVVTSSGSSPKTRHDRFTYVAPPVVLSVAAGAVGSRVTLHGKGFVDVHRVLFGAVPGTGVRVHTSTVLTVLVPAHAPGPVDVRIVTAFGTSKPRSSDRFTFAAPIAAIPPAPTPAPISAPISTPTPTPAPTSTPTPTGPPSTGGGPVARPVALPAAVVGQLYSGGTLAAAAGTPPYTWSAQGLPNGISVSSAGVVAGLSYAVSGTRKVTFTVTDAHGLSGEVQVPLSLQPDGGQLYSWGRGNYGLLGNDTFGELNESPVKIGGTTAVVSISGNFFDTFAVKSDGTVWAWGLNGKGQLGDGTTNAESTPIKVPGISHAVAVAAGGESTYVLLADGTVDAWGDNTTGELADNGTAYGKTPAPISGLSNIVAIAAYGFTAYAVRADGALMAWGQNTGLIGDGTSSDVLDVEQIPGLSNVVAVAPGVSDTFALHADGTVSGWGAEAGGALGNGKNVGSTVATPIVIPGLTHVTQLASGDGDDYALRSDGTILAWGANEVGEAGVGSTSPVTAPTQVTGITNAEAISAATLVSFAVLADGTLKAWGYNMYGQVGDGTATNRTTPVSVPGLTKVVGLGSSPYTDTSYAMVNPLATVIHPLGMH